MREKRKEKKNKNKKMKEIPRNPCPYCGHSAMHYTLSKGDPDFDADHPLRVLECSLCPRKRCREG